MFQQEQLLKLWIIHHIRSDGAQDGGEGEREREKEKMDVGGVGELSQVFVAQTGMSPPSPDTHLGSN